MIRLGKIVSISIYGICIATALISLSKDSTGTGYRFMPLLPLVFVMTYSLFLEPVILNKSIVAWLFTGMSFIRYVGMPLIIALTGEFGYGYVTIADSGLNEKAILLMIYEFLAISFTIFLSSKSLFKPGKTDITTPLLTIKGFKPAYYGIVLLTAFLPIIIPQARTFFSFLLISIGSGGRVSESLSTLEFMIRQVMITGIIIAFLLAIDHCSQNYKKTGSVFHALVAMIAALVVISIIVGERRSAQLYTAFACAYILLRQFAKFSKQILAIVCIGAIVVLLGMTLYKQMYAFTTGSYTSALLKSEISGSNLSDIMQSYFLGPGNIAIALQMAKENAQDPIRVLYDIGRSTVGLSFIFKGTMLNSNEVFNSYIYGTYRSAGHILSSIGYGYIYLGVLLAPLFSCALTLLSLFFERVLRRTSSLEVAYLLAFIIIRIQMTIFSNMTLAINMISTMFISLGLVYAVAKIMNAYFMKWKPGIIN